MTSIGANAFTETALQMLTIQDSVVDLDWSAMEGVPTLKTLMVGNGVTGAVPEGARCAETCWKLAFLLV